MSRGGHNALLVSGDHDLLASGLVGRSRGGSEVDVKAKQLRTRLDAAV